MQELRRAASPSALALALVAVGCGGGSTLPRPALPADETALLALAPSDAFLVARLDGRALRSTSAWEAIDTELEASAEDERTLLRGTDRVYFAIGGLVDVGSVPPRYDSDGNYVTRPAWAEVAELFSGKIPNGVLIVEGSSASVCERMIGEDGVSVATTHGFHTGTKEGITIATRGDRFCALTFEPLFERLLADSDAPSTAARRLASVAEGGSLGIASAAIEVDSPAFRSLVENAGSITETDRDSERWVPAMRRILGILVDGLASGEWEVREAGGRLESRVRIHASNPDRGVMWRELTSMVLAISHEVAGALPADAETHDTIRAAIDETRVERRDDGYVLLNRIEAESLVRLFHRPAAESTETTEPTQQRSSELAELSSSLGGAARTTIERYEPLASEVATLEVYERMPIVLEVARAYRSVGRFSDARSLVATQVSALPDDQAAFRASLLAERCELELDSGHARDAIDAADAGSTSCDASDCGDARFDLAGCGAAADAIAGNPSSAMARLDALVPFASYETGIAVSGARARVLAIVGRYAEAAATAEASCLGRNGTAQCVAVLLTGAEATAASTPSLEVALASVGRATTALAYASSLRVNDAGAVTARNAECTARNRLAPNADETLETCRDAFERSTEVHGPNHPATVAAGIGLVRAARAHHDDALARSTLTAVDAGLATLGPNTPVRAARASLGGRARQGR